jgi:hypothetical protein
MWILVWFAAFGAYNSIAAWMQNSYQPLIWYFAVGLERLTTPIALLISAIVILIIHAVLSKEKPKI